MSIASLGGKKGGAPIIMGLADNDTEDSTSMIRNKMNAKSRKRMRKEYKRGGGLLDFWKKDEETSTQNNGQVPTTYNGQNPIQTNDLNNSSFLGEYDPRNLYKNAVGGKRLKRKSKKTRRKNKKNKSRRKN